MAIRHNKIAVIRFPTPALTVSGSRVSSQRLWFCKRTPTNGVMVKEKDDLVKGLSWGGVPFVGIIACLGVIWGNGFFGGLAGLV